MSFLQPLLLWGLPLAALPVIIHLIHLHRRRTVKWAAMMFLLAAQRMNKGFSRLRQILILAFRVLAVMALVFVISRPLAGGWLGLTGGAPDTVMIRAAFIATTKDCCARAPFPITSAARSNSMTLRFTKQSSRHTPCAVNRRSLRKALRFTVYHLSIHQNFLHTCRQLERIAAQQDKVGILSDLDASDPVRNTAYFGGSERNRPECGVRLHSVFDGESSPMKQRRRVVRVRSEGYRNPLACQNSRRVEHSGSVLRRPRLRVQQRSQHDRDMAGRKLIRYRVRLATLIQRDSRQLELISNRQRRTNIVFYARTNSQRCASMSH